MHSITSSILSNEYPITLTLILSCQYEVSSFQFHQRATSITVVAARDIHLFKSAYMSMAPSAIGHFRQKEQ